MRSKVYLKCPFKQREPSNKKIEKHFGPQVWVLLIAVGVLTAAFPKIPPGAASGPGGQRDKHHHETHLHVHHAASIQLRQ